MNYDTATARILDRAAVKAAAQMRKERAASIIRNLRYGSNADVEAGVADVLERRRAHRVVS